MKWYCGTGVSFLVHCLKVLADSQNQDKLRSILRVFSATRYWLADYESRLSIEQCCFDQGFVPKLKRGYASSNFYFFGSRKE